MKLDLNLIVYFATVAEESSFRRAAERLRIAQPWLSRQIKKLEYILGFDLFIRTTRTVELTEKGRRLYERAQVLSREADVTKALAESLKKEWPGLLRVGVPIWAIYVDERELLFDRYAQKYPSNPMDTRTGMMTPELVQDLRAGNLDVIFSLSNKLDSSFECMTLCEGKIDILMPADDPLTKKTAISIQDLRGREVAAFHRHSQPQLFEDIYGELERAQLKISEYPNLGFTRRIEESGAVSAMPAWVKLMRRGVASRPFADSDRTVKLMIVRRRETPSPALENFWRLAKQVAENAKRKTSQTETV